MSDNTEQPASDPVRVLAQAKNAGALYHHISWTTKLLGQDLDELADGDYVLAFSVRKRGENVYVDRWSLEGVEPDGATGREEA